MRRAKPALVAAAACRKAVLMSPVVMLHDNVMASARSHLSTANTGVEAYMSSSASLICSVKTFATMRLRTACPFLR